MTMNKTKRTRYSISAAVAVAVLALTGCGGGGGGSSGNATVAREWLPKLQEENAKTCPTDTNNCSAEVTARHLALTEGLAADARKAGGNYAGVAALADRVNLATRYWEADCYPDGTYSTRAGMSCAEAFTLDIHGTQQLEDLLRQIARTEQPT